MSEVNNQSRSSSVHTNPFTIRREVLLIEFLSLCKYHLVMAKNHDKFTILEKKNQMQET